MDRDPNYVVVGAFVVLVMFMAGSFVFWYTEHQEKRTYHRYEIYFRGSVSGLSQGSPVRYLGVDVGKVARVMLDPKQRNRAEVLVDIDESAPVDGRTLASLNLQGVTGLLYIDLEQDRKPGIPMTLAQGNEYPVIRSTPSDFDVLLSSLPQLVTHTTEMVNRMSELLSDENVRSIGQTLDNTRRASALLPGTLHDAQLLIADLRSATQEIQATALQVHSFASDSSPRLEATIENARRISENLVSTTERIDRFLAQNEPYLSHFSRQGLPQIEQLLREGQAAMRDFDQLSRSLKQNPTRLLYQPSYSGVELPP